MLICVFLLCYCLAFRSVFDFVCVCVFFVWCFGVIWKSVFKFWCLCNEWLFVRTVSARCTARFFGDHEYTFGNPPRSFAFCGKNPTLEPIFFRKRASKCLAAVVKCKEHGKTDRISADRLKRRKAWKTPVFSRTFCLVLPSCANPH